MAEHLKHEGTSHSSSDLLNICVKMGASWSAQVFRQAGDTPFGPGAFLFLLFLKTWRTSSSLICSAEGGERVVWMVFFQTCNITNSDRLRVVDSPVFWGMVPCNCWCLSEVSTLKQNHWEIICSIACQNNSSLPLLFQCAFGLFILDFIPLSVSIFFGLTELSEFCSEPRFVVVVS